MTAKKLATLLLIVLASTTISKAQMTAMYGKISGGYNFWLYEPDKTTVENSDDIIYADTLNSTAVVDADVASSTDKKPLIIFLHGQSICGTDLNKVLNYGTMDAVISGRKVDAYVVGPQNPGGAWKPSKVADIIDWVTQNYPIDTTRIYLLGMSLGGFGTIDFVATYPERVAAAMAFCGGGSVKDYSGLCSVPLWIIHGTADQAVSVEESRRVVNAMKKAGDTSLLRYDEWVGVNHSRLARIFYIPEVYEWLFRHSLTDSPRQVDTTIVITNETLNSPYKGLNLASWNKKKSSTSKR